MGCLWFAVSHLWLQHQQRSSRTKISPCCLAQPFVHLHSFSFLFPLSIFLSLMHCCRERVFWVFVSVEPQNITIYFTFLYFAEEMVKSLFLLPAYYFVYSSKSTKTQVFDVFKSCDLNSRVRNTRLV